MEVLSLSEVTKSNINPLGESQALAVQNVSLSLTPIATDNDIKIPRPANAFMIFGKEYRKILSQKFPDFTNKQISKILGNEWKNMSAELKNHYHKLADETHKQHLIKYPGYYYSPLEARQRKAERKRLSKSGRKANAIAQTVNSGVGLYGVNRPVLMYGTYAMVRPMFGTPMPVRVRHAVQMTPIHCGPQRTFGGFMRGMSFGGFRPELRLKNILQLNDEHNYASISQQQPVQRSVQPMVFDYSVNSSSQLSETGQQNDPKAIHQMENKDLSALMTNYLPPMHNPWTEVTQVVGNDLTQKVIKDEPNVTKMADNESLPILGSDEFLNEVTHESVANKQNVIVKRIDQ